MDSFQQSVDQFEEIFERHPMPMWLFDGTWKKILAVNQAAQIISGYTHAELLLNQPNFLIHPTGRDALPFLFDAPFESGPQVRELRLIRKDGQWVEINAHCQRLNLEGQPAYLLVAQDISALKQSEQALKQVNAELSRSNAMIAALSQVAVKIESLTDVEGVIETLGKELEAIGLSSAITYLYPQENKLQIAYLSVDAELFGRLNGAMPVLLSEIQLTTGSIASDFYQPLFFSDVIEPIIQLFPTLPEADLRRFVRAAGIPPFTPVICLPLKVKTEVVGNLSVWGPTQRRENIPALTIFANQVAGAIEKARLFEAADRKAKETETLFNATTAVTSALELKQVLDQILIQLEKVVPYFSAAIHLIEGEYVRIVAARGFPEPAQVIDQKFPASDALLAQTFHSKLPLILEDAQKHPDYQNWANDPEVHGWMGVPLLARGQIIGYLTIDHHAIGAFQKGHATLAQAFANEVAIAIENARLFQEVQILAITDPLLEILNRRHFYQLANEEFKRFQRYNTSFSIIMFDLDHFKEINDRFGHQAGDQMLRHVAALCQENLREQDIFGRYGGEEFIILTHQADRQAAYEIANRLRAVLAKEPLRHDGQQIRVSASFGVCELTRDCTNLDELIKRTDKALYRAKNAGKNQVAVWEGESGNGD